MNLKEILSKHPEVQSDINALVEEAVKVESAKSESASEALSARVEKASKYLSSEYDENVKKLAVDCIKGTKSVDVLEAVVAHIDEAKAKEGVDAAAKETEEAEETAPDSPVVTGAQDGSIHDEDSYKSAVDRVKKLK